MKPRARSRFTDRFGTGVLVLAVQFIAQLPACAGSNPLEVLETSCGEGQCAGNVVSPLGDGGVCIAGEDRLRVIQCGKSGDTTLASIDLEPAEVNRTESPVACSASTCYFAECDRSVTLYSFPRTGGPMQSESLHLKACFADVPLVYAADDDSTVLVVSADGIVNARAPRVGFEVLEDRIGTLRRTCVQGGSVAYATGEGQSVVVSDIGTGRIRASRELGWQVSSLACAGDGVIAVVRTYNEEKTAVEFLSMETLDTVENGPSLPANGTWVAVSVEHRALVYDSGGKQAEIVDLLGSVPQSLPGGNPIRVCTGDSEAKQAQAMCLAGGSWYLLRPTRRE